MTTSTTTPVEDDTVAQLVREVRALRGEVAQLRQQTIQLPKIEADLTALRDDYEHVMSPWLDKFHELVKVELDKIRGHIVDHHKCLGDSHTDIHNLIEAHNRFIVRMAQIDDWRATLEKQHERDGLGFINQIYELKLQINGIIDLVLPNHCQTMNRVREIIGAAAPFAPYYIEEERHISLSEPLPPDPKDSSQTP
jgi:hypothetical protein